VRPPRLRDFVIAVVGGAVCWWFLYPASGSDTNPPTCSNFAGWNVSCGESIWIWIGPTVAISLGVMWLVTLMSRPQR